MKKNQHTKNHRWLSSIGPASNRDSPASKYALELLESRVLLSTDLAAAVPPVPQQAVEAPEQVITLNIAGTASGQPTFTVAEMLAIAESFGSQLPAPPKGSLAQQTLPDSVTSSTHESLSPGNAGSSALRIEPERTTAEPLGQTFGRLFPNLPPFSSNNPSVREALEAIGKKGGLMDAGDDLSDPITLLTDPNKSLNNPDNPQMTAGMTFLGQFLDHDLTLDLTSTLGEQQDPGSLTNFRTPAFELDSLYGGGPQASPQLYDQSSDGRGIKFLVEEIPDSPSASRGSIMRYDVPCDSQNVALIGDARNDENLIVSQLHLAFLKFHNSVVDHVSNTSGLTNPSEIFAEAQRLVRWHYQWIIVHEFLPKTVGPDMVQNVLTQGRQFYHWQNDPFIPVEFSVGAYRFGHSQVRPSYRANFGAAPGQEFFGLVFNDNLAPSQDHADLRGGERAARRFIDWQTFFDFGDGNVRSNKKIDTHISSVLFDLPNTPGTEPQSLAQRNLLRHLTFELPSGQSVAKAMGVISYAP